MKQKIIIIDNGWYENPRSDSIPEHRDPYEYSNSPSYGDPDDYNIM